MATIGWTTDTDALTYLSESIGASAFAAESAAVQSQYLVAAYRTLIHDPDYEWPTTATQNMKDAQAELALYIYQNQDFLKRTTLINQGVSRFKIGQFEEEYNGKLAGSSQKYPPNVANLIDQYAVESAAVGDWVREENT